MANCSTENLYLLEFLINDINVKTKRCDCESTAQELCVSFQFLDNQELQLCERDFDEEKKQNLDNHRIGKSCIFSLTPKQAEDALKVFDLNVYVQKKLPPEKAASTDAIIGTTVISIANLLADILQNNVSSRVLEECYSLEKHGQKAGSIEVYIRLSCYGKTVVTQFQMNMDDKTVLFKDKEGRSLYRYRKRKVEKPPPEDIEDVLDSKNKPSVVNATSCPINPCFPEGRPQNFKGVPPCGSPNMPQSMPQQMLPSLWPPPPLFLGGRMGVGPGFQPCDNTDSYYPNPNYPVPGPYQPPDNREPYYPNPYLPDPPYYSPQPRTPPPTPMDQEMGMFYSPVVAQQIAAFPSQTCTRQLDQQRGKRGACEGGCGK